jgi:hypothetical protein
MRNNKGSILEVIFIFFTETYLASVIFTANTLKIYLMHPGVVICAKYLQELGVRGGAVG